jgi:AcrR family transcriptional regulator
VALTCPDSALNFAADFPPGGVLYRPVPKDGRLVIFAGARRGVARRPYPGTSDQVMASAATVSPWKNKKTRRRDRDLKREAVLRAAADLFNEKGFHSTSIDDVARRLHVTKPTIYHYIENKNDILYQCIRLGVEATREAVATVAVQDRPAIERLKDAMREHARITARDFGMCAIRVGENDLPPEWRNRIRRLRRDVDRLYRGLVQQGIDEGSLAPADPKLASFTIAAAIAWISRWYHADGPLSVDDIADQCVDLLMNGLAIRPTRPRPGARASVAPR